MNTIDHSILRWAEKRGIFDQANPVAQAAKTIEEATETLQAIIKDDSVGIIDGIGDVYVTIVLLAHMYDTTVEHCAYAAYQEIQDRKGEMVNGMFVKDTP